MGTGISGNWVAYRAQTGGYDVEVSFDLASVINPTRAGSFDSRSRVLMRCELSERHAIQRYRRSVLQHG